MSEQSPPGRPEELPPEWREELEECFKATARRLHRVLLRFAQGDHELASVIVQETFRKAAGKWARLRALTPRKRRASLIRIALASSIDAFRRTDTERRKRPLVQALYQPRPADVHEEAMTSIAVERFVKVLNEMPRQQARVAFLYWRCEWTNIEIARLLDITPGRVTQHIAKARTRLISELSPYVPFETDEPEGGARP